MTGAIASVACANGKIHHFVCIKKDATLGHVIATFDADDNLTWSMGNLTGQAHPQSQIAVGSPNPDDASATIDVLYQHPSGAIVSQQRNAVDQQWGDVTFQSDKEGKNIYRGTGLAINYRGGGWPFFWQMATNTIGLHLKDGSDISPPGMARFHFTTVKKTTHFYYLHTDDDTHEIRHYASVNNSDFYDPRQSQEVPEGTGAFKVVDDSVSIIDVTKRNDGTIKSSVRLLESWLGADFHGWSDFSGPNTVVAADVGLTVYAEDAEKPSVFFTYVDSKSGNWIYLAVKQGQSVGYEMPIDIAKGWFAASDPSAPVPMPGVGYSLDTPHEGDKDPAGDVRSPKPPSSDPVPVNGHSTAKPINGNTATAPVNGVSPSDTTVDKEQGIKIPDWARKFCKDVIIPRAAETLNKMVDKKDGKMHAVLAPLGKLWNLGAEPLKYKFLDGSQYPGNDVQRQKVRDSIVEWTWYANIQFKEARPGESAPIKITFDPNDGSWSVIGNDAWKEDEDSATMNLGWVKSNNKSLPREERGVILHEFGHALGLLHEHQSPAHGSQSVVDPEAAIQFYMKDQGWTRDMVMDQVVKTYNLKDVSNFSEVDTKSIMHYYQPSEVTKGPPIDYNYVLSEKDKAYVTINYPRSIADEKKRAQGASCTLEWALDAVGLTDKDPATAKKILTLRDGAGNDEIDVNGIRRLFTDWAKAAHEAQDQEMEPTTRKYLRGIIEHQHGLPPPGNITAYASKEDPAPCEYGAPDELEVTADPKKARAVVNNDIFTRRSKFLRQDLDDTHPKFTWTIVADPASALKPLVTGGPQSRVPGKWEKAQVEDALQKWTPVCSIQMEYVEPSSASTADLIIVFQDVSPVDGKVYSHDDSANRSYCRPSRWGEDKVATSATWLGKRRAEAWAPLSDEDRTERALRLATRPLVPHDICLRGFVTEKTAADPSPKAGKWAPMDRSKRTIVHELGHFFGLAHEDVGLWGMMYEDLHDREALMKAARAANIDATVFDSASVMDSLRDDAENREEVHRWLDKGFKTVFAPSATDLSNLALFHAGPHLATVNTDKKACTLVTTDQGSSLLSYHGMILGLPLSLVAKLETLAKEGKWSAIRDAYLAHTRYQVNYKKTVIAAMTDAELKEERKKPAVAHGQKMRGADDNAPGPKDAFNAPMPKLKEVLWSKLNELFGPSEHASSFLTVQSPARYLDKSEFSYKMEGIYSNFVKPVTVNEAEFRLTDQLYSPSRVVGAPNGQSLSTNYEMILNNLVPRYVAADIEIRQAREKMRTWLLAETSSQNAFFVNDTRIIGSKDEDIIASDEVREAVRNNNALSGPRVASRMEVCQKLMLEYLEASSAWKSKHSKMIQDAMHVQTDGRLQMLEDAAREIANTAAVENSKLSAKYADVVVRGHLHTVRECLAQLDIKSTAEFLQDAKDSLRESALSSLYGASRVLPVNITPVDWSESLDTSFDPQDLSSDPAIIEMNITAKARQLDNLREQLSSLQHNVKGDEASLRAAMDEASDNYSEAQAALAGSYTESAKVLATRLVKAAVPEIGLADGITWAEGVSDGQKSSLKEMMSKMNPLGTINDLFDQMGKVDAAQRSMLSAGSKYSQRQTDWVRAKSATTAEQEASVSRKIEVATKELESLTLQLTTAHVAKQRRTALLAEKVGPNAEKENAEAMASGDPTREIKLPTMNDIAANATDAAPTAGSRWIAVTITSKEASEFKSSTASTSVSRDDWGVSFFGLASGGSGNTKSEGSSNTSAQSSNLDVDISMNCTMVTCDRSSWFQPQFFSLSDAFMRNNNNVSWNAGWDEDWKKDTYKAVDAAVINATKPLPDAFLPCFPTGYIIVKDVLIKISKFKIKNVADKKYLDEKTTSGGGFLFFSTSKTTQKTEDSASSAFQMASDGMIVRIPGPQVIGYIQQMLPYDGTHPFKKEEALQPDIFLPEDDIEYKPAGQNPGRTIGRGMEPTTRPSTEKKKVFTVRSTKPASHDEPASGGSETAAPGRAQAPKPKQPNGNAGHDETSGEHVHDDEEMDHAMKVITAKLREKLNEPGFLEKLLSGSQSS